MSGLREKVRCELSLESTTRRREKRRCLPGFAGAMLLWGSLAAAPAHALSYNQELIPDFSVLRVAGNSSPQLADLDGDGDFDAIVGQYVGGFTYFANTGDSSAPAFIELTGSANPLGGLGAGLFENRHLELVDLDGDGDLDALIGRHDGTLLFYANTGNATAAAFVLRTGTANPFTGVDVGFSASPDLVDLDGDGDLDAVIGEGQNEVHYFANTGSASAPAFVERTGGANPFATIFIKFRYDINPVLADFDGDGDLDLTLGEAYGQLLFFRNFGSLTAPAFSGVSPVGTANPWGDVDLGMDSHPALADLDGDGDVDGLVGERYGLLHFFENTASSGTAALVEATGSANPFGDVFAFRSPELKDLDGDGDFDMVSGKGAGTLGYFANTGNASAPAFAEQTGFANPFDGIDVGFTASPVLGDLDGDGDLEAVIGDGYGTLRYFENTGSSSAAAFVELGGSANPFAGIDVGTWSDPDLVDLDGDGDLDVAIGRNAPVSGGVRYLRNTGSSSAPSFVHISGTANPFAAITLSYARPCFADLDFDGDFDLLVASQAAPGIGAYYENTGTASLPAFIQRTGDANPFGANWVGGSSELVDLDHDRDFDLVVGAADERIVFLRADTEDLFADGFESGDTSAWSSTVP